MMEHVFNPYNKIFLDLGPLNITWYAALIALGAAIGLVIGIREAKKYNISADQILDAFTTCFVLAILGARLYYCIFYDPVRYFTNPVEIIRIWDGGLAIHGALIVTAIYIYYYCKKHKINLFSILEAVMPSMMIAQAIGRWGNFMNQEAHGPIINVDPDLGREFLENTLHLPDFVTNQMYLYGEAGLNYYHPTFLYESVFNLIGALLIIFVFRKIKNYKVGDAAGIYLIWYGALRFCIEILRTDALMLFGVIKVAQLISIIMIILGIGLLWYKHKKMPSNLAYVDYINLCKEDPTINNEEKLSKVAEVNEENKEASNEEVKEEEVDE